MSDVSDATSASMDSGVGVIADVQEGMDVLDRHGERVGTVAAVTMGDSSAVTSDGQEQPSGGGVFGDLATAFAGSERIPEGLRERLRRVGYIEIDSQGLFTGARYAASEDIDRVADGVVHLSIPSEQLVG